MKYSHQHIAGLMSLLFFTNTGFAGCVEETVTDMTYRTKDELIGVYCNPFIGAYKTQVRTDKLLGNRPHTEVAEHKRLADCVVHNADMAWLVLRKDHGLAEKPNCGR